ncbi:MAG: imidazole glycerol phosphate synthase HisHF [Deltaproteobacteria bacterium]|nr:MAG: imidazole glycerol phosphate synthase HisHF [Deltaproteobacteria bacterium]
MITLLDYGAGNVRSITNALGRIGETVRTVGCAEDILRAEKLIFPGVGSYGAIMDRLHALGYLDALQAYLADDRPFFGICLGMQVLFSESEEAPGVPGLGLLPGRVQRFTTRLAVPHIGWNGIRACQQSRLFNGLTGAEKFYFVHSYHVVAETDADILTQTDYGVTFTSAVQRGNLFATQFHPEKSGAPGLRVLENFLTNARLEVLPAVRPHPTRLAKRIIACLDVRANDEDELVVTKGDQYEVREKGTIRNLGSPVQLASRYYQQGADEITFLNIMGFRDFPLQDMPMLKILEQTSEQVFVPLTIGGGIRDFTDRNGRTYSALEVAAAYFRAGADKVSIGSDAVAIVEQVLRSGSASGTSSIEEIARVYGNQAVVISVDPRRVYVNSPDDVHHEVIATAFPGPDGERYCWYQCTIRGGREGRDLDAITLSRVCEQLGAGEILLNCIDRDGTNKGFDLELITAVRTAVTLPVIASSGAGTADHFLEVFRQTPAEAALAAGIFHRQEVPLDQVKKYLADHLPIRVS